MPTIDEAVERAARDMWEQDSIRATGRPRNIDWNDTLLQTREKWIGLAKAALSAFLADVPVSEAMVKALEAQFQHWKKQTGTNGPYLRAYAFTQTIFSQLAEEIRNV